LTSATTPNRTASSPKNPTTKHIPKRNISIVEYKLSMIEQTMIHNTKNYTETQKRKFRETLPLIFLLLSSLHKFPQRCNGNKGK
jgi:hypothetical protein